MREKTAASFIEAVTKDEALNKKIASLSLDETLKLAEALGYTLTEEELKNAATQIAKEPKALTPDELKNVSGGTAFTAGNYDYYTKMQCPTLHRAAYRTGNEREDPVFFFWSQHQIEYHCPDCNNTWWVTQEHDDPARP